MKKGIFFAVSILVVVVLLLSYGIFKRVQLRKVVQGKVQKLAITRLLTLDSLAFQIPRSGPFVIIYFDSKCDVCTHELNEIKDNISKFNMVTVILVSSEYISAIKSVSEELSLSGYTNIYFVKINSNDVYSEFGSISVPHIFIYDLNRQLIKEFKGEVKADNILKYCR